MTTKGKRVPNDWKTGQKIADGERYAVVPCSVSGHCCFSSSIVDTTNIMTYSPEISKDVHYDNVAEFFDDEMADRVCTLLNEQEAKTK